MRALALAALVASSTVVSWAEERSAIADDGVGPAATANNTDVDVQKRVRELIYVLRYHRASARVEDWTGAMRELVGIGKPAVPELVAELDRTDRPVSLRGLAFTLRAIGDPRAVPSLIRALGKKNLKAGSDYGSYVLDPELMAFMQEHQCFSRTRQELLFVRAAD
jgi:HEAT repeat protein